jgi:hypothetical protein
VELDPDTRSQVEDAVHEPFALLWNRAWPLSGDFAPQNTASRTTVIVNFTILVFIGATLGCVRTLVDTIS